MWTIRTATPPTDLQHHFGAQAGWIWLLSVAPGVVIFIRGKPTRKKSTQNKKVHLNKLF